MSMEQEMKQGAVVRPEGGTGRRVLGNTAWLTIGQMGALAGGMFWTAIVARYIGPETYGTYSYANAIMAIVQVLVTLGMDQLIVRDLAQRPEAGWRYLAVCLPLRLALGATILAGYVAYGAWRGAWGGQMALVSIVIANNLAAAVGLLALHMLYAREAMAITVIAQLANSVLTLLTGGWAVWARQPFSVVLLLSLGATLVQLLISFASLIGAYGPPRAIGLAKGAFGRVLRDLLIRAAPFAALALMAALSSQLVSVLLGIRASDEATRGYFGAASRIYLMALIVPDRFSQAILPAFSRVYAQSAQRFAGLFEQTYRYILAVTVPMAVGLWVISPRILDLLYGAQYRPAAGALRILSLILLSGAGYVMGPAMTALNKQSVLALIWGSLLLVTVLIGYVAIPVYGAEGASWALLVGQLAGTAVYSVLLFRWLRLRFPLGWVNRVLLAALAMGVVTALLIQRLPFVLVAGLFSPAVYVAALVLLGTFSAEDWHRLLGLLPAPILHGITIYTKARNAVNDETGGI